MLMNEKKLKKMIQEAVEEALTVEITLEKRRDEKTGLPLKHPEIKTEQVFLPSFFCQLLPFYEASNRGMQETVDKKIAVSGEAMKQIEAIGNILLGHEENLIKFAKFITYVQEKGMLMEPEELQMIEAEVVDEGSD